MTPRSTIIGTQIFSPGYHFTNADPHEEGAGRIAELGTNIIKFSAEDIEIVDRMLARGNFSHVLLWNHKSGYEAIYDFACKLLSTYNGSGISFYVGHWEGDWLYLKGYDTTIMKVDREKTEEMIDWLNTRQRAIDDAKRDTPHENVWVWHYTEINRPTDVLNYGADRLLNRVIPYLNVDYVSYSAYDCMELSAEKVREVIDAIYAALPAKEGIPGNRVFIGEFGMPHHLCDSDPQTHAKVNLQILAKFLACPVKFILYWQIYCNEHLEDGSPRGFWLIDSENRETPLYTAFQDAIAQGKAFIETARANGKEPTEEEYRQFLLSLPCFHQ